MRKASEDWSVFEEAKQKKLDSGAIDLILIKFLQLDYIAKFWCANCVSFCIHNAIYCFIDWGNIIWKR